MSSREDHLTRDEAARLDAYCDALLTREGELVAVSDESVYAYLSSTETPEQRVEVDAALLASRSLCRELLEISAYLDDLQVQLDAAASKGKRRRRPAPGFPGLGGFLRRPRLAIAGAAVVVAVALGALYLARMRPAVERVPSALHLAVLPIECLGGGVGDQTLCDGLAETMTDKLSQLERFHRTFWVVPAGTVTRKAVSDPVEAGRTFGVELAVTGSLRRFEGEFKLILQLLNVASVPPRQIASAAIAGPLTNMTALQAVAARRIAEMMNLELDPEAQEALTQGDTDVSEAYKKYLEGRGYLQRYEKVENLESAIEAFEGAIERDSAYALAHAGLAEAYWRRSRALRDAESVRRAADECARALELNDKLAQIHVMLGRVRSEMGEYEEAISAFQTARGIDSTATGLYNGLARAYAGLGRVEEAESTYVRAIRVKPDYWGGYNDLGFFYYTNGRFEEAAQQYTTVTELTPDNYLSFSNLGGMYYYLGRWDDAKAAYERSIEILPTGRAYNNLGSIHYIEGNYEVAVEKCQKALELNESNYRTWANLANAYYWIPGKRDQSFPAYRRAIELAEERLQLNPRDARLLATLASYYVMVDEDEKALSYVDRALGISDDKPFVLYFAGYVYEQLGQRERAFELIGKALDLGYPLEEIERDPWLADFRADKRFDQLLLERE